MLHASCFFASYKVEHIVRLFMKMLSLWLLLVSTVSTSLAIERPEQMGNFLTLEAGEYK